MKKVTLVYILFAVMLSAQSIAILSWTTKTPAPAPARCQIQAHGNVRDTIYICGGRASGAIALRTVQAYVPATNAWIPSLPSMPGPRSHGCGDVIDSIIYAVGGFDSSGTAQATLYAFYVNSKTWATLAPMPTAVFLVTGAEYGGRFYVFGSQNSGDTLFEYNPGTNSWTTRVPTTRPLGRRAAAAVGTSNYFYIMGGLTSSNVVLQDCWRFTRMMGGSWTQLANMPGPRCMHAAYKVMGDSVIYVVGGNPTSMGAACDNIVYKYTIATDTWTTDTPMPTARGFLTVDQSGGKIYAICGINGAVFYTTNEEGGLVIGVEENKKSDDAGNLSINPNPFQTSTRINIANDTKRIDLKIYDVTGTLVRQIMVGLRTNTSGKEIAWFGDDDYGRRLTSGVYFLQMKTGDKMQTGKVLLLK